MIERRSNKALVTLLVGDRYVAEWQRHVRASWQAYADRHGYDLLVLDQPLIPLEHTPGKSIHWQKLLIPSLKELRDYEWLVWLDGDVVINHHQAPCIVQAMSSEKIGAVDIAYISLENSGPRSINIWLLYLQKMVAEERVRTHIAPTNYMAEVDPDVYDLATIYALDGFTDPPSGYINTGVLVMRPAEHAEVLRDIFLHHKTISLHYENTVVSYLLLTRNLVEFLDPRFNAQWGYELTRNYPFLHGRYLDHLPTDEALVRECVDTAFAHSYFLHFAGSANAIKHPLQLVNTETATIADVVRRSFPARMP